MKGLNMGHYKTGKHLDEFKKDFLKKYDLGGYVDRNWKKRWLPYIKYDHDWDGMYILFLILAKLHIMYDFYSTPDNCVQSDEGLQQTLKELKEAIDFGEKFVQQDNYDAYYDEALQFMQEHTTTVEKELTFFETKTKSISSDWDSEENQKTFDKLMKQANKKRKADLKKFFNLIADGIDKWWD